METFKATPSNKLTHSHWRRFSFAKEKGKDLFYGIVGIIGIVLKHFFGFFLWLIWLFKEAIQKNICCG